MSPNKNQIKFSLVIPTFNRSALLLRCIESIKRQTYSNFEIIVVDDGSTDGTKKIISKLKDPKILYRKLEHGERSKARNTGIEIATGDYVCFIDDDDEVKSDYLEEFSTAINEQVTPTIIRCGFIKRTDNQDIKMANYSHSNSINPVSFFAFNMCGVGALAIPKDFLNKDRFPQDFPHWQDTHLFLRLFSKFPFKQIPNYSYIYHIHSEMGSKASFETEATLVNRVQLNIDAIEDLFEKYGSLINQYVPNNTKAKLTSQKFLQHSVNCLRRGQKGLAKNYFSKAMPFNFPLFNLKLILRYYLLYFKS